MHKTRLSNFIILGLFVSHPKKNKIGRFDKSNLSKDPLIANANFVNFKPFFTCSSKSNIYINNVPLRIALCPGHPIKGAKPIQTSLPFQIFLPFCFQVLSKKFFTQSNRRTWNSLIICMLMSLKILQNNSSPSLTISQNLNSYNWSLSCSFYETASTHDFTPLKESLKLLLGVQFQRGHFCWFNTKIC